MNNAQILFTVVAFSSGVLSFSYIAREVSRRRGGFFSMYRATSGHVERVFDDILFRDSVIKSMLFGFNFFAIESLLELIIRGETSFSIESLRVVLSIATVLVFLYILEDIRRFARERSREEIQTTTLPENPVHNH